MKTTQLAEYLTEKRLNAGLTQTEIARVLGYTTSQFISNWERGLSAPPLEVIKKLAKLYHVSSDELFKVFLEDSVAQFEANLVRQFYGTTRKRV
ncbi:MAG: helix-turn-helix domain-containing protein [Pseudobdellovibrionaceae bacterium]